MKAHRIRSVKGKKIYGYIRRRPSRKGVLSILLFTLALLMLVLLEAVSYHGAGEAGALIGAFGLIAAMLAGFGIRTAKASYHEPNRSYTVSHVGVFLNSLLLICFVILFLLGLIR